MTQTTTDECLKWLNMEAVDAHNRSGAEGRIGDYARFEHRLISTIRTQLQWLKDFDQTGNFDLLRKRIRGEDI